MYPEDYGQIIPILADNNSNNLCIAGEGEHLGVVVSLSHDEEVWFESFLVKMINDNANYWGIFEFPKYLYF